MFGSPPGTEAQSKDLNRPFNSTTAQMSSGLLRYRSAPSSLLQELSEDFLPIRPPSPDTESMFARFLAPDNKNLNQLPRGSTSGYPPPAPPAPPQQPPPPAEDMMYQQMVTSSMAMDDNQLKNNSNGVSSSNLIRHSSSPAGLFANLNADQNGYGVMRGMSGNNNNNGGNSNRLKSQLSYSSRQSSLMSHISEMDNESIGNGYNMNSWEESPILSNNNFSSGMKRPRDAHTEHQNGDIRNGLNHQFSLPKTTNEMAAIEKFLQFQDSVPCKIRAKRGCATHPRSIAERVRRTRISERMRKLQELVPNMDKQTNTADMLDLAVDYIKDLQKQVKGLSDSRANCTCSSSSKQKPYINPRV